MQHKQNRAKALAFLKYIGPGLLVTVGFIDPGNWASNIAAGSEFGYTLLWMVTLSTIMLIILQHNAAHLGIATGLCLSEATTKYTHPAIKWLVSGTAMLAAMATAMAEILGGAIALEMLFHLPIKIGALIVLGVVLALQMSNSYNKIEKIIIGFVSIIGLSFIIEVILAPVSWGQALTSWVTPSFPKNSLPVIMSVLGAVVMPHNLFLHSEVIQSRHFDLENDAVIEKQLKYEFMDTLTSMIIGWVINSAMIIVAAATFFAHHQVVTELAQAQAMLKPLLGSGAAIIFALALLFAGIASSITAGMAGGTIYAGMFAEPYDIDDPHTKIGVLLTMIGGTAIIFFISNPFTGLVYSQMLLSIQLPLTIFTQIYLTSSPVVMGKYANDTKDKVMLWIIGIVVTGLNIALLISLL